MRCCRQPPCRREQHRPGRRRAMAPFPVDPSGGDGRGCARLGAGGTPALPGSLHPMTSSHQGGKLQMILVPLVVEGGPRLLVPCLFVSKSINIGRFSSNGSREFPKGCKGTNCRSVFCVYSCLFVSIGGSSSLTAVFPRMIRTAPHPVPLAAAELQCDAAGSHPVGGNSMKESHGAVPG